PPGFNITRSAAYTRSPEQCMKISARTTRPIMDARRHSPLSTSCGRTKKSISGMRSERASRKFRAHWQLAHEARERPADREAFCQFHLGIRQEHSTSPFVDIAVYDEGAGEIDV